MRLLRFKRRTVARPYGFGVKACADSLLLIENFVAALRCEVLFFAEAVTATQGAEAIHKLAKMAEADTVSIAAFGRAAPSAARVHAALLERPIVTANWLVEKTGLTAATVNKALENLERIGIVRQLNDAKRNRLFAYGQYA